MMESFSGNDMDAKPLKSRNLGIVYFCDRALILQWSFQHYPFFYFAAALASIINAMNSGTYLTCITTF